MSHKGRRHRGYLKLAPAGCCADSKTPPAPSLTVLVLSDLRVRLGGYVTADMSVWSSLGFLIGTFGYENNITFSWAYWDMM